MLNVSRTMSQLGSARSWIVAQSGRPRLSTSSEALSDDELSAAAL
jgi:hypothetical protein